MKRYNSVFFADEKKNQSLTKWTVVSDIGSLAIQQEYLEFDGRKSNLQISNIKQISITRQQLPWISFLIMDVLVLVVFGVLINDIRAVLLYFLPMLVFANAFAVLIMLLTKWIKIEYAGDEGQIRTVFLADGSFLGWGGVFGGTDKLHRAIKP